MDIIAILDQKFVEYCERNGEFPMRPELDAQLFKLYAWNARNVNKTPFVVDLLRLSREHFLYRADLGPDVLWRAFKAMSTPIPSPLPYRAIGDDDAMQKLQEVILSSTAGKFPGALCTGRVIDSPECGYHNDLNPWIKIMNNPRDARRIYEEFYPKWFWAVA